MLWLCYDFPALIGYVIFTSLDVVSAKTGLSPCGLDPVFVLKTKATRWCPRESTQSRSDEISVQLTDFLIILY